MEFLLYLAGPITGVSYHGCTTWREYVMKSLPEHIIGVSPMRGKKYLEDQKIIGHSYEHFPLSTGKGITCRDRSDVMRCNMLFVNFLGAKKISIGTVGEIFWADAWRKPTVVAMEKGNIHEHPMIKDMAGFIVPTLDEAIAVAVAVLSPKT